MDFSIIIVVFILLAIVGTGAYFSLKPKKFRQRASSLYSDALNAIIQGEEKTAINLLREIVRRDSNHVEAYLHLGNLLRIDNPQHAIKIHQSLTVRPQLSNASKIDIHHALALDYLKERIFNRAKQEAEQVLKIDRRNKWAMEFLLNLAEQEHNWTQAARIAKMLQRNQDKHDQSQLAKYKVYEGLDKLANGDRNGARAAFLKAVKIQPTYGIPYFYLGNLYEEDRDLVKAIDNWEQYAIHVADQSSKVFTKIEAALFDLGRFSEVEKFYRRILRKDPGNLEALAKLANVLEEKGERQTALGLVEEALSQKSNSLPARLMKLKLSLHLATPHELANQIDDLIERLTESQSENGITK